MHLPDSKTILLVEDELIIAMAEKVALERYGYAVIVVNSGEKAIAAIEEPNLIDLILMDIDLGSGIDGTEAAARILKDREVPIVFLSSHVEQGIVNRTESITSYGYVVKNCGITVLDASIKMAFKLFYANRRIMTTKDKLEATLDALPDPLFEVGLDGYYYDIHSTHTELLFRPASELLGKRIQEVLPADIAAVLMSAIQEAHEKGFSIGRQYELSVPAGRCCFEISVAPIASFPDRPHFIFLARDITERKKTEFALRTSEEKFRTFFSDSPTGMFRTRLEGGELLDLNDKYLSILGWTRDECMGRPFLDLWADPEERRNFIADLLAGGQVMDFGCSLVKKDGTLIECLASAKYFHDQGIIEGSLIDITKYRKNERDLRESESRLDDMVSSGHNRVNDSRQALADSEERLSLVLSGSGLGYWDWDLGTNIVYRDARWAEMLGYGPEELEPSARQWAELCHPDDYEYSWKSIQDHLEGRSDCFSIEYRLRTKDGSYKWVLDSGKIVKRNAEGHPERACGTQRDITKDKEKENRIRHLLDEKELILKEVHHRIKNNMNTMKSLVYLQRTSLTDGKAIEALKDVESRFSCMLVLYDKLNQSGTFGRMSLRNYRPSLVEEVLSISPRGKSIEIRNDIEEIVLDSMVLQTIGIIVNELLTNIMKYAFPDAGRGVITVTAVRSGDRINLSIHDDGVGMPENIDFSSSTGFGLSLIEELTKQLDGHIRIERGAGTTIRLDFAA